MAVNDDIPFKIHVAKAKDLPLSWYELILRPEKFAEHLQILRHNPEAAPNAAYLIVTFLDKSGVYSVLSNSHSDLSFTDVLTGEKQVKLVKCALMVASALHWDSPYLWQDLPHSVQYCLVSLLCNQYPSPNVGVVNSEGTTAHVIFSTWVLRFLIQQYSAYIPARVPSQTWEANCTPPEQIKDLVKSKAKESLLFLTEFLKSCDSLSDRDIPSYQRIPRVCVDLPVLSGEKVHLEPFKEEEKEYSILSFSHHLCKVAYVVGCYHFLEGDYQLAHQHLNKTQQLLTTAEDDSIVDRKQLKGFLVACEDMLKVEREEEKKEEDSSCELSLARSLESYFQADDFKSVGVVLAKVVSEGATTLCGELESLERRLSAASEDPPQPKRQKLESTGNSLSPGAKVTLCSALGRVLEGKPPPPRVWRIFMSNGADCIEFLLQVSGEIMKKKDMPPIKKLSLQNFMRSVCSGRCGSVQCWEKLLSSKIAQQLCLSEDSVMYKSFLGEELEVESDITNHTSSEYLERKIAQVNCSLDVISTVEEFFKSIPVSQHRAASLKWVGSSRGYAHAEGVSDPVSLTKYNCLVFRAQLMAKMQLYANSQELFSAALELLRSGTFVSSKFRKNLDDYLEEQVLVTELMGACKRGQEAAKNHAPLIARAKAYYAESHHWSSPDSSSTLHVVGAYLLNVQDFSFLSSQDTHQSPSTVAPRLAEAVIDVTENRETRKSIRSLFETVLSVFSPLLHSNEGKAEINEKQSKLRANLDLLIRNLNDSMSLSLLAAALARIWNLLKKPEDDILTDFNGHWPTAIGNAANIDVSHVFRMLNTTINHAFCIYPYSTSWMTLKANVNLAVGEYGAAVEGYMEAAALASDYFHKNIPEGVWSQVIIRRLINCCCQLSFYTQAVIFCQLLQPVDYDLAFSILRENVHLTVDSMFPYFWDMTIIEYLIYVHSKKTDSHKQTVAIQVAGQADLNFNNSLEVLSRAADVRRKKFLRTFYSQITHTV